MYLPKITLQALQHRDQTIYCLVFNHSDKNLWQQVHALPGRKWTQTYRCWYVPVQENTLARLFKYFKGIAYLDYSQVAASRVDKQTEPVTSPAAPPTLPAPVAVILSPDKTEALQFFKEYMQVRRYSGATISSYCDGLKQFFKFCNSKSIKEIGSNDLQRFNSEHIIQQKRSASYQNQVINAVKLFFSTQEKKELEPDLIKRPKRAKVLPNVLSKEETKLVLTSLSNLKHKTMLSLIYACGLRCGELLALRARDFDFD